jgi:hypothetical protein
VAKSIARNNKSKLKGPWYVPGFLDKMGHEGGGRDSSWSVELLSAVQILCWKIRESDEHRKGGGGGVGGRWSAPGGWPKSRFQDIGAHGYVCAHPTCKSWKLSYILSDQGLFFQFCDIEIGEFSHNFTKISRPYT